VSQFVAFIDETPLPDPDALGGKGSGLAFLSSLGARVPPAFVVTVDGFRRAVGQDVRRELGARAAALPPGLARAALEQATRELRRTVMNATEGHPLRSELLAAYEELRSRCGTDELAVAVRSSSASEDSTDRSFAGEHDTYLWVVGPEEVDLRVRDCWASLFTARAVSYRAHAGEDGEHEGAAMAVVVQQMAPARTAGVFMTLNPANGDRSKIVIESVWGLGEPLVSGEVTPDRFVVDKVTGELVRSEIADKPSEAVRGDQGLTTVQVAADRRTQPSLAPEEIAELVRLGRIVEKRAGGPQDVEFAVVSGTAPGNVLLLQCRPETMWSTRPRKPAAQGSSALGAVLATLTKSGSPKAAGDQ
jgi:pyruvate,water dikinase